MNCYVSLQSMFGSMVVSVAGWQKHSSELCAQGLTLGLSGCLDFAGLVGLPFCSLLVLPFWVSG